MSSSGRPPDTRRGSPKPRLRIALAGAGYISHYHLVAWARQRRADVVAICDPTVESARQRAAVFGIPSVFERLDQLLDAIEIDAVDIASPRETHAELVALATGRGIDVLCQKPVTPTLAQAETLARGVEGKARVMVHENWRFRPWYRTLKAWVAAGDLGRLCEADMAMHSSGLLPDAAGIPQNLVRHPYMVGIDRLMIADVLIHHLDVVRWLFGPLRLLDARTARTVDTVRGESLAVMLLETSQGVPITVRGSMAAPGYAMRTQDVFEAIGDRRTARLDGTHLTLQSGAGRERDKRFDFARAYQRSFDGAIGHFVESLIAGTDFETDLPDNLETLRLVEQAYEAAGLRCGSTARGAT